MAADGDIVATIVVVDDAIIECDKQVNWFAVVGGNRNSARTSVRIEHLENSSNRVNLQRILGKYTNCRIHSSISEGAIETTVRWESITARANLNGAASWSRIDVIRAGIVHWTGKLRNNWCGYTLRIIEIQWMPLSEVQTMEAVHVVSYTLR